MSKSKRIVGPFTSEFGTFNPGDSAIAVTVCTGRVNVARVEYVGYVERQTYNWNTKQTEVQKFAQIRRPSSWWGAFWKGTDQKASWPYGDREVEYRSVDTQIITTMQYNRLMPSTTTTDELIKVI